MLLYQNIYHSKRSVIEFHWISNYKKNICQIYLEMIIIWNYLSCQLICSTFAVPRFRKSKISKIQNNIPKNPRFQTFPEHNITYSRLIDRMFLSRKSKISKIQNNIPKIQNSKHFQNIILLVLGSFDRTRVLIAKIQDLEDPKQQISIPIRYLLFQTSKNPRFQTFPEQ